MTNAAERFNQITRVVDLTDEQFQELEDKWSYITNASTRDRAKKIVNPMCKFRLRLLTWIFVEEDCPESGSTRRPWYG